MNNFKGKIKANRVLKLVTASLIVLIFSSETIVAKEKKSAKKTLKTVVGNEPAKPKSKATVMPVLQTSKKNDEQDKKLASLSNAYAKEELSDRQLIEALGKIDKNGLSDQSKHQQNLMRWIALVKVGLPVLAGVETGQELSNASSPMSTEFDRYWILLKSISADHNIQFILSSLFAKDFDKFKDAPSKFGNDYYYYLGNFYQEQNKLDDAKKYYQKLTLSDRDYLRAKYQLGLILYSQSKLDEAILQFKIVLNNTALEVNKGLSTDDRQQLLNYTKMAVARIFFEKKEFKNAINFYRAVDRDSNQFYQALFEQSWAFFLAGYPNHALGSLYSVNSPFFDDKFNPEAGILSSLIYYWMCRYDDSSLALEKFKVRFENKILGLDSFLNRKRLNAKQGYELFENYLSGVSAETLKMDPAILATASNDDSLWSLKFQMAALIQTEEKIKQLGLQSDGEQARQIKLLRSHLPKLKESMGEVVISSLEALRKQYERISSQAQFLNIELLMSKKEKVLGRELHANSKIDRVSKKDLIEGWSRDVNSWAGDNRGEYWWDEIGFHIYDLEPHCQLQK